MAPNLGVYPPFQTRGTLDLPLRCIPAHCRQHRKAAGVAARAAAISEA